MLLKQLMRIGVSWGRRRGLHNHWSHRVWQRWRLFVPGYKRMDSVHQNRWAPPAAFHYKSGKDKPLHKLQ
eukprot:scaffold22183_cov30-Prasinocladus_malaysianus.AAC.1